MQPVIGNLLANASFVTRGTTIHPLPTGFVRQSHGINGVRDRRMRRGARLRVAVQHVSAPAIMISQIVWIAVGSAVGGVTRFGLSVFAAQRWGENFPWGTLIINVTGSFLIGFFATLTQPDGRLTVGGTTRQFVMTGILGGYTTYSSFSWQTLVLAQQGEWLRAGSYATGTFVLCFVAVWLGYACAAWLNPIKGS